MRKLILIKHASPFVIPGTPPERWKLSDKGREACAPLAEAIRSYDPEIIVASEEPKARETAEEVGQRLGVPVKTLVGLAEHDRSNVPHMRSGEFISHVELFLRRPRELVLGKETAEQAEARFESAVNAVLTEHREGNIAIVTHGTVLALFVAKHSDRKAFDLWREMGLPSYAVMSTPEMKLDTLVAKGR